MLNLESWVHIFSIGLGLGSLAAVLIWIGVWKEKIAAYDRHISSIKSELNILPTKFVTRELYDERHESLRRDIGELKAGLMALERTQLTILIALGRMEKFASLPQTTVINNPGNP